MDQTDIQWAKETHHEEGQMDAVLLIGQSNMCGRGIIGSVPPIDPRDKMFMLRNGRWQPMSEPINPDRRIFVEHDTDFRSGISLAASFAEEYAETYNRRIGLIPCADGGTSLCEWQPGRILFDHAVMMSRLAQRTARIVGILWHQGESDSKAEANVSAYEKRFFAMLDPLMEQLGLHEKTPVILGELTERLPNRWPYTPQVNEILRQIAKSRLNFGIAKAVDLPLSADNIHFSGPAYRVLGRRYFSAFDAAHRRIEEASMSGRIGIEV